jgi:hypothetical protein
MDTLLTTSQMAMVSNKFLGSVAVRLGIHRHLNKWSSIVAGQISSYAEEIELAESEATAGPDAWTTTSDPPKVGTKSGTLVPDVNVASNIGLFSSVSRIW